MDLQKAHLGSFYLAFHPQPPSYPSLAVDLSVKLHVDGRRLHADLRVDRAHFGSSGRLPDLLNCALLVRTIDADLAPGRP